MKKTIVIIFIVSLSVNLYGQDQKSTKDSINVFYNKVFAALKSDYLFKKTVDWKAIESATKQHLQQYASFEHSLDEIKVLFDAIAANHCLVYYKGKKYASTGNKISEGTYTEQWKRKYATKPVFEVKMLDNNYGYILMPGMVFFDLSAENIHQIAQPMYNQIAQIQKENNPKGWIIDLRLNTGGNATPMLLALADFLGNTNIWGSLDLNKMLVSKVKMDHGKYLHNGRALSFVNVNGNGLEATKVAVITGPVTASSGEVTALAFKGRPNTVFIGEQTLGFTTGNISYPLPFGVTMALTTTFNADRNGHYHERIVPDIVVSKQDNFDDLLADKNIIEAIKFIKGQE